MWWEEEIEEDINVYNINDNLKHNKEIQGYLRKYYNENNPIRTNKKLDKLFYYFKEDLISLKMGWEIKKILKKIY